MTDSLGEGGGEKGFDFMVFGGGHRSGESLAERPQVGGVSVTMWSFSSPSVRCRPLLVRLSFQAVMSGHFILSTTFFFATCFSKSDT